MYYLRTIDDNISINGLWFDLDKAKTGAMNKSKEIKECVFVVCVNSGKSVFNTIPLDFL